MGTTDIAAPIVNLRTNPALIFDTCSGLFLSLPDFLQLMSSYTYLWSCETVNAFADFLCSQNPSVLSLFSDCFMAQPLTQIYFQSALRPLFQKFARVNIVKLVTDALIKVASLMPSFLRRVIAKCPERHIFFFDSFLKHFVIHHSLFGIADPELPLFAEAELAALLDGLSAFFHSSEAIAVVDAIVHCERQISIMPSELALRAVCPSFQPVTLVDSTLSDQLFYIPMAALSVLTPQKSADRSDSLTSVTRRFLIASDLVKIEEDCQSPFAYFMQMSLLSDFYGKPEIELELDQLQVFTAANPGLDMDTLVTLVENELDLEIQNATEDPLCEISAYSSQYSYLTRLTNHASQISTHAKNYINFLKAQRFAQTSIPLNRSSPFLEIYTTACASFPTVIAEPSYLSYRSLFSVIAKQIGLELRLNERDAQVQEFLRVHRAALLESQNQPFLQVYHKEPSKLELFVRAFKRAFETNMPFVRLAHIHSAYQILTGLLQMQNLGTIGADQLVPFAIVATVCTNPPGLASTCDFLGRYVEPLVTCGSPVDHEQEYTVVQFMSTCKFLFDRMEEVCADGHPHG
jgi:hypothetical protein